MRISRILTTLSCIASATAIDAYLYSLGDCYGTYVVCTNLNPNQCCRTNREANYLGTVSLRAIPTDWNIEAQALEKFDCNASPKFYGYGAPVICIRNGFMGHLSSVKYYFRGKKARDEMAVDEVEGKHCEAVRPNTLGLANGTEFDLTGFSDDLVSETFALAQSRTQVDAFDDVLSRHIHALKLSAIN